MSNATGEPAGRAVLRAALVRAAAVALLASAPATASAQARVTATLDADEIALDDTVMLKVVVQSSEAPEGVEFPKNLPFTVVRQSQSTGSSFSLGGGGGVQISRTLTLEFQLAPRQAGELTIPPVTAVVGGKRFASEPVTLRVLPEGARPKPPPGPSLPRRQPGAPGPGTRSGGSWRGWERDLRLAVEADRREVYLGEQLVLSAWVVSPVPVVTEDARKEPTFEGFWKEPLEYPRTFVEELRIVDGMPFRTYLLSRTALVPMRAGELVIEPFHSLVKVRVGTLSPFDPFPELRSARLRSERIVIKVKPLPPGAPAGFSSVNVGAYTLEATVSEAAVAAGQPVTVKVIVKGEGNVRALALPQVPELPGVRRFEPTQSEKVSSRGGLRLSGSRTVETVLVPERPGELVVPALAWPVFDPGKGAYQVLRTEPLRVTVRPAAGVAASTSIAGANALGAGLRPIRADADLAPAGPPPWRSPGYLAALAAPMLALLGLGLTLRVREKSAAGAGARRTRWAGRTARRRLGASRKALARGDRESFLAEVERALAGYCADRLGAPVAGMTRESLWTSLGKAGAHGPAVRALEDALVACDAARYGRAGAGDGAGTPEEALLALSERALALLDEADWSTGRAA